MKKVIIALIALPLVLAACKQASTEERVAEFNAAVEKIYDNYVSESNKVAQDKTLENEAFAYGFLMGLQQKAQDSIAKLCEDALKEDTSGDLALAAFSAARTYLEEDVAAEIVGRLTGAAAEQEDVVKLKQAFEKQKNTSEGKMFTDFTIVQDPANPEASTVKFSDYVGKGKWVLVDFWASWCGPCKKEIPNIAAVYDKYKGDKFDVLSIAVWDKVEDTKASAIEHNIIWSQIINAQTIPTDIYGIDGIPHIMLIAPDGTIAKRNLRGAAIEEAVAEALGR